jgi:hypothetical protein
MSYQAEHERLEKQLREVEESIYRLETSYFEKAPEIGNIVQGWCNTPQTSGQKKQEKNQPRQIAKEDRIFSNSSVTAQVH